MIYMAAGNSRRFGSNKLFYPIDGKPMYRHVLERLTAICERHSDWEIVLVSQYEELLEQGRTFAHRTVFSPESRDGASWTIKNGLKEADDTEAFVFFTADQPWLRGETVLELIELFLREGKGIACVEHSGKTGNPCIFSRKYFGELMELEGDVGGKRVIRKHREDTAVLEVLDERELTDVDVAGRITKYGRR